MEIPQLKLKPNIHEVLFLNQFLAETELSGIYVNLKINKLAYSL